MERETDIFIGDLRKGKRSAQEKLLALYGPTIFRQIARIVARQEDAEEVYQDVFVKALRAIGDYDPRQASLATWLSRIAYNESVNFARRSKHNIIYIEDPLDDPKLMEDPTTAQHDEQTLLLMEQALDHLPPGEQSIVTMFYYDGMSLADIAYVTGSIPSTIGSQLSRIRKKLYRIIKTMQK